jgi:hypothetical protein
VVDRVGHRGGLCWTLQAALIVLKLTGVIDYFD